MTTNRRGYAVQMQIHSFGLARPEKTRPTIIIIIIMEKTEAGHQWPLYPRNTFGIITLNYIQLY